MFLYKYDMEPSSKLKAGPIWDFSSVFLQTDVWSNIHILPAMRYDVLLQKDEFLNVYQNKWQDLSGVLCGEVEDYFTDYMSVYGEALQHSLELDTAKYGFGAERIACTTIDESISNVYSWFETRTLWLDREIPKIKIS